MDTFIKGDGERWR